MADPSIEPEGPERRCAPAPNLTNFRAPWPCRAASYTPNSAPALRGSPPALARRFAQHWRRVPRLAAGGCCGVTDRSLGHCSRKRRWDSDGSAAVEAAPAAVGGDAAPPNAFAASLALQLAQSAAAAKASATGGFQLALVPDQVQSLFSLDLASIGAAAGEVPRRPAGSCPPLDWIADLGIFREQAAAAAAAAASAAARRGGNMINVKVHINDALNSQRAILMRPKMQTVLPTHRTCCTALEATQGQNDSFISQLPYECYLFEVASVGD